MFSVKFLNELRLAEIEAVAAMIPPGSRVLEIGAGTGRQALRLSELGYAVDAIDLPQGTYAEDLVFQVRPYDGVTVPWPDASFDVVYSSNLLEHVADLRRMHAEIRRLLRPGGTAVHVVPTHTWRAWTTASSGPDAIVQAIASVPRLPAGLRQAAGGIASTVLPRRHGERGNFLSETWLYHPRQWRRTFRDGGFTVVADRPVGYFYTGNMLLGPRLTLDQRKGLARILGSSSHVFRVIPADAPRQDGH